MNGPGWHGMPWMGWGGWLGMILFWILIILAIAFLVRLLGGRNERPSSGGAEKSALDLLKERYARGEIDREEFQQKKKDLLE